MKLTIERASLLKSLGHVQSVVERRNTIPILANVLLEADDDRLGLAATDMDLNVVVKTDTAVSQSGATTTPAHILYDIVRKLPDGAQVELDASGDERMTLKAGRSEFTLATLPKEDFPILGEVELPHRFSLAAAELRNLIDRTRFAISTEETRYYLNGIFLHAFENGDAPVLRAVATDGHRLARFEMPLPEGASGMPAVIVPRKAVGELRKLIDEGAGAIEVSLSDTRICFSFEDTVLSSKLIDGTFPDYERVIPTGNDKMMGVDRKSFHDAVDRVSTISTEKSRAVKLSLADGALTLSATSPDSGKAVEELEVDYHGDPMEIGFNSKYLLDVVQQIEGEVAQFMLADAVSPTIARDTSDASALYVLMPMRV